MTLQEALDYYKTAYKLAQAIGISGQSVQTWKKNNKIPLLSQQRIQQVTNNALIADPIIIKKRTVRMLAVYE